MVPPPGPASVLLAGGGSAGHVSPLLATADALRRRDPDVTVTALGTETGLEARLVPARGYDLRFVPRVPLPRRLDPRLFALPGSLRGAVAAARRAIDETGAQVVVGFGGYVSAPAYLAARQRRVPIVVHEQNATPGVANRLGARLTRHVFTGNPGASLPHARYIGIPLRREITELDRADLAGKARAHFGFRPDLPVLLVTGGSQGARSLNQAVLGAAGWIREAGVQLLHIVGPRAEVAVPPPGPGPAQLIVPYMDRMDLAYAAADLMLCRAGAMTCAEVTAVGLPAAYVPLPHGNGEQMLNAEPIVRAGGGLVIEDSGLTPEWIRDTLLPVLLDPGRLAGMSRAAAALGVRDADTRLAAEVISVIRDSR